MAVFRLCIASAWLDQNPPAFLQWRARMLATCTLEVAILKSKGYDKRKKGMKIWEPLMQWIQIHT